MNIAYFRESNFNALETISRLKDEATARGFTIVGQSELPGGDATVITICRGDWAQAVVDVDPNLLGLLPCSVTVIEKDGKIRVGAGTPTLLGQVVRTDEIFQLVEDADAALRGIVEHASGVEPLKPKALILYSSHTCPYCVMEKKWLDENEVDYKLIYVDEDQQAALSLMQRSGQRGVPITEVTYDNNEIEFIVGFDRAKLEPLVKQLKSA
ncbi:MAG: DUF302 domain-containing protein [Deltaproteobacteria bacterium]|nr:DUF302 domain-containing protein [Deltaproteobacteria bacterium]